VQAPLTHAELEHATGVPQLPPASHVCTPLPEHCVVPGVQEPVQTPLTHAALHDTAVPHRPLLLQVWTALPEHWVAPGEHTPVQPVPTQA